MSVFFVLFFSPHVSFLYFNRKAKKKQLDIVAPSAYGVDPKPTQKILSVAEPPARKGGAKVADVDELVAALKKTGLVK